VSAARANTYDFSAEWYFDEGALLSAAVFCKDINTFVQTLVESMPFNQSGYPMELLAGTTLNGTEMFALSHPENTSVALTLFRGPSFTVVAIPVALLSGLSCYPCRMSSLSSIGCAKNSKLVRPIRLLSPAVVRGMNRVGNLCSRGDAATARTKFASKWGSDVDEHLSLSLEAPDQIVWNIRNHDRSMRRLFMFDSGSLVTQCGRVASSCEFGPVRGVRNGKRPLDSAAFFLRSGPRSRVVR
jgi:hypothetical protein